MKMDLTVYDMQREFVSFNRDYFSMEGYEYLFDYYNELDENWEPDVIAICCDWTEYADGEELAGDYDNIYSFAEYLQEYAEDFDDSMTISEIKEDYYTELVEQLEERTTIIKLTTGYLVLAF